MRARSKAWANGELAANPYFIRSPEENRGNWSAIFGNDNPIFLEIGCGKGKFICDNAERFPDTNFVALERAEPILPMSLRLARERGIGANLRFIMRDAGDLRYIFADGELSRVFVNFCDPWHRKRKWFKRRLTHRNFLAIYEKILNGELHLKTDNSPLFEFSLNELSDCGWRLKNISLDLANSGLADNIMTEFEEKFSALGLPIYRLEASKP